MAKIINRINILLISILAFAFIFILIINYFGQKENVINHEINKMEEMSQRYIHEINDWVDNKRTDSEKILAIPSVKKNIFKLLDGDSNKSNKTELLATLEILKHHLRFRSISLVNSKLETELSTDKRNIKYSNNAFLNEVLKMEKSSFSNVHLNNITGELEIDLYVPIFEKVGLRKRNVGIFIAEINPSVLLNSNIIKSHHIGSETGECIITIGNNKLVQKIVVINELRHFRNNPLGLTFTQANSNKSFMNFLGSDAHFFEGPDYRNENIIAIKRKIKVPDWNLIVKIDKSEILSDLNYRTITQSGILVSLFVAFGFILSTVSKQRKASFYKEKYLLQKEKKDIEKKLVDNEQRLREAQKVAKLANWTRDLTNNKFNCSNEFCMLLGFEDQQAEKSYENFISFLNPTDAERFIEKDNECQKLGGIPFEMELVYNTISNEKKFGLIKVIYEKNSNGKIVKSKGTFQDITNLKEKENVLMTQKDQLEKAQSIAHLGFINWNLVQNKFVVSKEILKIYDLKESEFTGPEDIKKIVHPEDLEYVMKNLELAAKGIKKLNIDNRVIRPDGKIIWVNAQAEIKRDKNGKPIELLGTVLNINERIENSIKIKKYAEELEVANNAKDKFFSIIGHDLKSPFQGLMGCSSILSEDFDTMSDEEKLMLINSIQEISKSSYSLLEDLLTWASLQTGRMEVDLEYFNLKEFINPSILLSKHNASNKNINIHSNLGDNLIVKADKNMLATIIRNLLSNAIKFTNKDGEIILSAKRLDEFVDVSVKDNGVGIKSENISDLFRMENNITTKGTNNETGTGLGLSLCKEMIEKMNGSIRAESELGKGSNFIISIPV